jgi:hypothetical protein
MDELREQALEIRDAANMILDALDKSAWMDALQDADATKAATKIKSNAQKKLDALTEKLAKIKDKK